VTHAVLRIEPRSDVETAGTEEAVRALFENSTDALFVAAVGLDGSIRFEDANRAFNELARPYARCVRGSEVGTAAPTRAADPLMLALRRCRAARAVVQLELPVRSGRTRELWEFRLTPIGGLFGAGDRVLGAGRNVTELRRLRSQIDRITRQLLAVQDEERRRIARELHDSAAPHLIALAICLSRLESGASPQGPRRADAADDLIAEMRAALANAQREIRAFSYLLHPPELDDLELDEALRRLAAGFSRRTGIATAFHAPAAFTCPSPDVALALLRIAQEALTNVYRHAEASSVEIRLARRERSRVIEIEDDGRGLCVNGPNSGCGSGEAIGVGIAGMRARARELGGALTITSGRRGTLVRARIPDA
jgi:signal transduction histidine kinase